MLILREQRAKVVFDGVTDGVLICDEQGQIEDVNPALAKMMKCYPQAIIGTSISQLFSDSEGADSDDATGKAVRSQDYLMPGKTLKCEALRTSGEVFPMEATFSEIALAEGQFFAGVMRDVSERKQQEAERQTLI